ncbi:MAG: hypothetical protein V4691_07460 [Pseudomonadota bacterium]
MAKDINAIADTSKDLAKISHEVASATKTSGKMIGTLGSLGGVTKILTAYFSYRVINDAAEADRKHGDRRTLAGIPMGNEARWSYTSEAAAVIPLFGIILSAGVDTLHDMSKLPVPQHDQTLDDESWKWDDNLSVEQKRVYDKFQRDAKETR